MYLYDEAVKLTDTEHFAQIVKSIPQNLQPPTEQVAISEKVEVWVSEFKVPGPDFNIVKGLCNGQVVFSRRWNGY